MTKIHINLSVDSKLWSMFRTLCGHSTQSASNEISKFMAREVTKDQQRVKPRRI